MRYQSVQIGIGRISELETGFADVVNGLVVDQEDDVNKLDSCVVAQNRVVRFDYGSRYLK